MNANVTEQELVTIPDATAMTVFTTEKAIDPFLARIRAEIDAFVPEMGTSTGRKEIASMAYRVARSKTYLEGVGKRLADEAKLIPKKIDATRKHIKDTLDDWRDEVRKPLTEWEQAEEARVKKHADAISAISAAATFEPQTASLYLKSRLEQVEAVVIGPDCEEFEAEYARAKDASRRTLQEALARAEKYEAEQAELARLRQEAEERAKRDREEAIAREAARAAEAAVIAKAEREKQQAAEAAKAEQDRIEAKARAEREAAERRERDLKAQAEAAEQRAAETEARIKREADLAAARERQETEKREANRRHVGKINRDAMAAFVSNGIDGEVAKAVITLVALKKIPAMHIDY